METSSVDGKNDAIIGLIVIVVFPIFGYLVITNTDLILDNAVYIIAVAFLFSGMILLRPRIKRMLTDTDSNQQEEPTVEDGQAVQSLDLETADGIELDT